MPPSDFLVAAGFYGLAGLSLAGAIGLIVARNVFHSALFLVLSLGSVAGVFVVLGADFLAGVQVLIYVGAVMILILFGVMLTPQSTELPNVGTRAQVIAGASVATAIFLVAVGVLATAEWPRLKEAPLDMPTSAQIGSSLFNVFVLPFEVASLLLLVAMIGAIVIAREG